MRLVVPFKRNYLNRTKIWTLGSPKFRVNRAKIIVKGSRVNKVPVKFISRTKIESLVSLIIFLVTGSIRLIIQPQSSIGAERGPIARNRLGTLRNNDRDFNRNVQTKLNDKQTVTDVIVNRQNHAALPNDA